MKFPFLNILLLLSLISYSYVVGQMSYRTVDGCPDNEVNWTSRSLSFRCKKAGQRYHCLLSTLNSLVELCHEPRALDAKDGCPILEILNSSIYIKSVRCLYESTICPNLAKWDVIFTHQMYKYPDCIHSEMLDQIMSIGVNESTDVTTPYLVSKTTGSEGYTSTKSNGHRRGKSKRKKRKNKVKKINHLKRETTKPSSKSKPKTADGGTNHTQLMPYLTGGSVSVLVCLGFGVLFCVMFRRIKKVRNQLESVRYTTSVRRENTDEHAYMETATYDQITDLPQRRSRSQQYFANNLAPPLDESYSQPSSDYLEPVSKKTAGNLKNHQYVEIVK